MNTANCPLCGRFMKKDETSAHTRPDGTVVRRWTCPNPYCEGEATYPEVRK